MFGKLVAFMRFEGFGLPAKSNPLRPRPTPAPTPLAEVAFAPNPGNLRAFSYVPRAARPLVVLLHGCGQTAAGYDQGTGWSELAARHGFALLAVEQKASNNPNTCFDWFLPDDITRGSGEAASIAAMIHQMVSAQGLDASRVFVTGLSAGGAMTAAMLAGYPELFAGGAIFAGLPFGAAANVRDALDSMRMAPVKTPREWGDKVRAASAHAGPWPRLSIWHGDLDMTVNISNAQALAAQWADVHGLALADARQARAGRAMRLAWGEALEVVTVSGLGHGVPIAAADIGLPGPFMIETGISSTRHIAQSWGLLDKPRPKLKPVLVPPPPQEVLTVIEESLGHAPPAAERRIEGIIRRALKAAGLLRD
jgi:poly(hydroxyalkanoate) depolymerase family esterase